MISHSGCQSDSRGISVKSVRNPARDCVQNVEQLLEHSISYFSLWKPCIIREQCTLWRHSLCAYVLRQLKHRKLCFVQVKSTVQRHFVLKLHKRTQLRYVLLYGSVKTQWCHAVLYNWTMHAFLCFNCLIEYQGLRSQFLNISLRWSVRTE